MTWQIVAAQDEASHFEDHIRSLLIEERPPLPPRRQRFAHVQTHWRQVGPGRAFIRADGGTHSDRLLAREVVASQLRPYGLHEAQESLDPPMVKEAQWDDVMAKAKRLIQTGNVQVLRNGYTNIVGTVKGDTGTYEPEIFRQDPNSRAITGSSCECGWGEFQNQPRTRQWKRYQDRPCSHILALYWQSLATPLDEDAHPGSPTGPAGGVPGPGAPGVAAPGMTPPTPQGPQGQPGAPPGAPAPIPQVGPGGPQGAPGAPTGPTPGMPSPTDVLPQFQGPQEPQHNPASVPGLKGPTPTDPLQFPAGPGSTFSSIHMSDDDQLDVNNGDLVQLRYPDQGTLVGRSEEHGAGSPADLPAGLVGEVLGTHPSGMVNVLYMGKPFEGNTYFEPFGAQAWHFPSYLIPRPDLRQPGPALRRKR